MEQQDGEEQVDVVCGMCKELLREAVLLPGCKHGVCRECVALEFHGKVVEMGPVHVQVPPMMTQEMQQGGVEGERSVCFDCGVCGHPCCLNCAVGVAQLHSNIRPNT